MKIMNHRLHLLIAAGVVVLTHAPFAGADMSTSHGGLGMNYAGDVPTTPARVAFQSPGMNYAGQIANASAAAFVPMDAAVETAERQTAGQALSAELTGTRSGPAYLVEFAGNGMNRNVWVDARTGRVEKIETLRVAASVPGD